MCNHAMMPPRVLIISINPLSATSNNGKTFASFFKGYPRQQVAQLYFHRETPSSDVCSHYYRIGDEEYARYHLRLEKTLGAPATTHDIPQTLISPKAIDFAKASHAIRLLRSVAWTRLDFNAPGVHQWLCKFQPEIIFFCGGDANYLYAPVLKLARELDIPFIYYITDDYVLPDRHAGRLERIKRSWTRQVFLQAASASAMTLTIGSAMSQAYRDAFGIESETIMNLVDLPKQFPTRDASEEKTTICYVGGLHLDRWRVLLRVADSLRRLAQAGHAFYSLDVYAPEVPSEAQAQLSAHPHISYRGHIPAKEVPEALARARVLLHVESFDPAARRATLLSISTKIPEYLIAGRCILAVGPAEAASIKYLREAGAAFVVSGQGQAELDATLESALSSEPSREQAIEAGFCLARQNHDGKARRAWFHQAITELTSGRRQMQR